MLPLRSSSKVVVVFYLVLFQLMLPNTRKKTAAEIRELLKRPVKEEEEDQDEEEELLRELAKIKAEKAKKLEDEKPDIFQAAGKSWREDKIFDKQISSKKNPDRASFLNDTLRSDFHRKFLDRYIAK